MSINQRPRFHYLLLVCSCYLLPLYTQSTPIPDSQSGRVKLNTNPINCVHDSIAELIKTSPVILKALGARIFTESDLVSSELWRSGFTKRKDAILIENEANLISNEANQILITLTPETIYKGASLLKMTQAPKSTVRITESAYLFEGQLNATLEPLSCFDTNVLKMLPTELIAFGKLVTVQQQTQKQQQQQQHQQQEQTQQQQQQQQRNDQQQHGEDILRISINGLHRWSPQFENHIWKHLGWDDWSDFTLCSVTCGKGVQQRFRRCLLDNPMMNLNMNMHSNQAEDEDNAEISEDDNDAAEDRIVFSDNRLDMDVVNNNNNNYNNNNNHNNNNVDANKENNEKSANRELWSVESEELDKKYVMSKSRSRKLLSTAATLAVPNAIHQKRRHLRKQWFRYGSKDFQPEINNNVGDDDVANDGNDDDNGSSSNDDEVMRVFEGDFSSEESSTTATTMSAGGTSNQNGIVAKLNLRKKKKSAKSFSTLFCEGYNIEQRNCNTFECSDDISELLKFYKKYNMPEDLSTSSIFVTQPLTSELNTLSSMATTTTDTLLLSAASSSSLPAATTVQQSVASGSFVGMVPSSTPANMGYVKSWHNNTNFTIMITLRVKNDTKTTARIFSIRNSTHNLYLEPSTEGLRLYLERDKTTEMLPVKFNLYDNRWHQVAISIQNGDFISIFVDCLWSNSFVVSKRLFSLPLDAEVEIGRGFNGELQQLLVLPENQERQQCSNVRTSINEVKRYIIDTFIDDYSN